MNAFQFMNIKEKAKAHCTQMNVVEGKIQGAVYAGEIKHDD